MPKRPKYEPAWKESRQRWLVVGPRPERKHWYFENRTEAKSKQRELLACARQESIEIPADLARSALHWDEEFRDHNFTGLEHACQTFSEQLRIRDTSPTLIQLLEPYLQDHPAESTRKKYNGLFAKLSHGLLHRRTAGMTINFWRQELSEARTRNNWSNQTFFERVALLRSLYEHAKNNKLVQENPIEAIVVNVDSAREIATIEPDSLREILSNCLERDRPCGIYFAVLAFAGLRPDSEFNGSNGVRWEDIRWNENQLPIRNTKTAAKTKRVKRYITINPTLRGWLEAYRKPEGKICPWNKKSAKIHRDRMLLRSDGSQIVVWSENGSRDILRHSYASYLLPVSDPAEVMRNMGHTSLKTTLSRYEDAKTPSEAREYWALTYEEISQSRVA